MRLLRLSVVLAATLLIPVQAYAWFGLLDYLSGPGKFRGALYDVRLICFGGDFEAPHNLQRDVATALKSGLEVAGFPDADRLKGARIAWETVLLEVVNGKVKLRVPPFVDDPSDAVRTALRELKKALAEREAARPEPLHLEYARTIVNSDDSLRPVFAVIEALSMMQEASADTNQAGKRQLANNLMRAAEVSLAARATLINTNLVQSSVGVLISLCSPEETRKVSVDLGVDFWHASSNPIWANTFDIKLRTVVPSISWRLFNDNRHDIIDLVAAGGWYRFSSGGFEPITGLILQPRIAVHGPTAWKNQGRVKAFMSLVTISYGVTNFPMGIMAERFGGLDPTRDVSPREWTHTGTIFFDVTPFLFGDRPPRLTPR